MYERKRSVAVVLLLLLCHLINAQDFNTKFFSLNPARAGAGTSFSFTELKKNKASVMIFLSPDCPLCQNYALTIKQMQEEYERSGIRFYGIFPGTWYSDKDIQEFKNDYHLNIIMLTDRNKTLVHLLNADVTPEVVIVNNDAKILYQGRIDNWMYAAGKKRAVITKHELKDALEAIVNNRAIAVTKTEAVGCLIE